MVRPDEHTTHFGNGKVATRRNMRVDRQSGNDRAHAARNELKRSGSGRCNWGRPGDEMVFDAIAQGDPAYDSCDELFENAFGKPRGGHVDYDWSQGQDLSSSDCDDMDEIEEAMFQDWLGAYEQESTHIQDEGEEFFNMVDAWGPD